MNKDPPPVENQPLLRGLWNQAVSPVTFDFSTFLAALDCFRQIHSPNSGIDLNICAGGFREVGLRDQHMTMAEKRWRLKGVILDLCELLPTIRRLAVTPTIEGSFAYPNDARASYWAKRLLEFHQQGANPRVLRAPAYAVEKIKFPRPYVTMTLRTSNYFPDRNANLLEWHLFHQELRAAGFTVVVVPDQGDVLGQQIYKQFDWHTYEPACFDLRLRQALYENAIMNIGSSNGPVGMMFYSEAPVLQFDQLRGGVYGADFWRSSLGFPPGEQYPWSRPDQRMTWTDSTYENMVREWNALKLQ